MDMELDFAKEGGLVPAIAQDAETGDVLMLAYINEESWNATLKSGCATYWSRSRKKLWKKGESSGNTQRIKEILVDCDNDAVVFKIEQIGGAACHMGYRSCFFTRLKEDGTTEIIGERVFNPDDVYGK
ncbi:MAG: phosphoribosyl-AMP cyclohydrolase [Victivallales bacterium]|nr:phosphoribosyl-AMP cyclohydrolase [Victivallales bacterium]